MNIQGSDGAQNALAGLMKSRVDEVSSALDLHRTNLSRDEAATMEAAEQFESYFNTMLIKELRKALPDGFFKGTGSDVYTAWFDEHVGQTLANQDALGIAQMVRASFSGSVATGSETPDFANPKGQYNPEAGPSEHEGGRTR